jgi:hypothetical protein
VRVTSHDSIVTSRTDARRYRPPARTSRAWTPRALSAAAEQAAGAGDYALAKRLLRTVLGLQEAQLGPTHVALADTLNNLGVLSDRSNNVSEAESCYRRAYGIAASTLPADHPFVTTSRDNLRDFCVARGLPLETAPLEIPVSPPPPVPPPITARAPSGRRLAVGLLVIAVVVLTAALLRRSASNVQPQALYTSTAVRETSTSLLPSERVEPEELATREATGQDVSPPATEPASAAASGRPFGARGDLCAALSTSDWNCVPAEAPVRPGTVFFYTRVQSAVAATVLHLWYQGDRLHQRVELQVLANQNVGYRTFSRSTVSAGEGWRVELRTGEGTLLHEERFTVR